MPGQAPRPRGERRRQRNLGPQELIDVLDDVLDDKVFLENKRIMQLIRSIESGALGMREARPPGAFMEIELLSVDLVLPFERPLYEPSRKVLVDDSVETADDTDVDASALFGQFFVDKERLRGNIDAVLAGQEQATLAEVTDTRSCWTCIRRTRSSYSPSTSGTATGLSTWPNASSPRGPGTSR